MCKIDGCEKKNKAHGLCAAHYARLRLHGDPLGGGPSLASRGEPMRWLKDHKDYSGDDCLRWPFQRDADGYARMSSRSASQVMLELTVGPAAQCEDRIVSAHSCGNGHEGCVNPKHLRWATQKENIADKKAHGTHQAREKHGMAKLTSKDVERIRSLRGEMYQWQIAEQYGISQTNVSAIQRGETWR